MVMRLFGLKITVEKDIPYILINEGGGFTTVHIEYEVAKKHFLKKVKTAHPSIDHVEGRGRIPPIRYFRDLIKERFEYPISLREAKDYVERYYGYKND